MISYISSNKSGCNQQSVWTNVNTGINQDFCYCYITTSTAVGVVSKVTFH